MNNEINKIKEEFANRLHIIQHEFYNKLDKLIEQTEPQGKWKPEMGEEYYYANPADDCFFDWRDWQEGEFDIHLYNAGLIRQTENEAIELGKQMYYTQWFNDLSDVTDEMWEDEKMPKYNKLNDTFAGAVITNSVFQYKYPNVAYFSSKEKLEAAIETIGKENFDKYVMRIKE